MRSNPFDAIRAAITDRFGDADTLPEGIARFPRPLDVPLKGWEEKHFRLVPGVTSLPGFSELRVAQVVGVDPWARCEQCPARHIYEVVDGYEIARPCACGEQAQRVERFNRASLPLKMALEGWSLEGMDRTGLGPPASDQPEWLERHSHAYYLSADGWKLGGVVDALRSFLAAADKSGRWLVFTGPNGLGKTYLSACLAKHLILRRGFSAAWVSWVEFLQAAKSVFSPEGDSEAFDRMRRRILDTEFLFLDDVGRERSTEWTKGQLADVLEHRDRNGAATVISTNMAWNTKAAGGLHDYLGDSVYSRLRGRADWIIMRGPDRRGLGLPPLQ